MFVITIKFCLLIYEIYLHKSKTQNHCLKYIVYESCFALDIP